jgi:hypothetical protein
MTLGKYLDLQVGGITKHNRLNDARRNVGASLVFDASATQCCCKLTEVTVRRNLEHSLCGSVG